MKYKSIDKIISYSIWPTKLIFSISEWLLPHLELPSPLPFCLPPYLLPTSCLSDSIFRMYSICSEMFGRYWKPFTHSYTNSHIAIHFDRMDWKYYSFSQITKSFNKLAIFLCNKMKTIFTGIKNNNNNNNKRAKFPNRYDWGVSVFIIFSSLFLLWEKHCMWGDWLNPWWYFCVMWLFSLTRNSMLVHVHVRCILIWIYIAF